MSRSSSNFCAILHAHCLKGPGLQTWTCLAAAGSRQRGFQYGCSHEMKVLHGFSYFLWCRNCGRVKSNDNFILPCFLLESGMKVTGWARFQRGIKERLCSYPHFASMQMCLILIAWKQGSQSTGRIFPPREGEISTWTLGRSKTPFRGSSWGLLLTYSLLWSSCFIE